MLQWKIFMVLALIGHVFCGISDCLLTYAPNGKVDLTNFKDYEKSSVSFRGMPRWACIFNLLPLAVVTLPTKLPAKANVIGAGMFLGLLFLM